MGARDNAGLQSAVSGRAAARAAAAIPLAGRRRHALCLCATPWRAAFSPELLLAWPPWRAPALGSTRRFRARTLSKIFLRERRWGREKPPRLPAPPPRILFALSRPSSSLGFGSSSSPGWGTGGGGRGERQAMLVSNLGKEMT